jgi:methyltransferase (TIGR00027 family)
MSRKGIEQQPSRTAAGMAFLRALANKEFNDDKLGSDYLAEYFISFLFRNLIKIKKIRARMRPKLLIGMYEYSIARTQFFDAIFKDALNKNIPQIVILGAGYDTRAYRFAKQNKKTNIIELDVPTTQNRKNQCLKKANISIPANVELVPINFNKESLEDVLEKTVYDRNKKTLFLWEGVTYYLEPESVIATLEFIKNNSPKESIVAFDYSIFIPLEMRDKYYGVKELSQLMAKKNPNERGKFALEEDKVDFFVKERGFRILEHLNTTEIEKKFLINVDGSLIGHIIASLRFISASPINNVRSK